MKETSHHVIGDRDRAQRGVHGPALEWCAGRSLEQQVSRTCERVRVDVFAQDPPQRLHTANLASGDRRLWCRGAPHLRNVARHFTGSEVVEERVHYLGRDAAEDLLRRLLARFRAEATDGRRPPSDMARAATALEQVRRFVNPGLVLQAFLLRLRWERKKRR